MKAIVSFIIGLVFFLPQEDINKAEGTDSVEKRIESIFENYGEEKTNITFFSLEEIRPFSILQFESTISIYDNGWQTPDTYLSQLNNSDRDVLKKRVTDYINGFEDSRKEFVVSKLSYYLNGLSQIENIKTSYSVKDKEILSVFYKLSETKNSFDHVLRMGEFDITKMNDLERNEAEVNALNSIASLSQKEQMLYYSEFYKELSKTVEN